jgi:hypothetical protein
MQSLYIGDFARVMDFDAEYPVDIVFDLIVRWHGLTLLLMEIIFGASKAKARGI